MLHVDAFASYVMVKLVEDYEGISEGVAVKNADGLVFRGVGAVSFSFVPLGQANF